MDWLWCIVDNPPFGVERAWGEDEWRCQLTYLTHVSCCHDPLTEQKIHLSVMHGESSFRNTYKNAMIGLPRWVRDVFAIPFTCPASAITYRFRSDTVLEGFLGRNVWYSREAC